METHPQEFNSKIQTLLFVNTRWRHYPTHSFRPESFESLQILRETTRAWSPIAETRLLLSIRSRAFQLLGWKSTGYSPTRRQRESGFFSFQECFNTYFRFLGQQAPGMASCCVCLENPYMEHWESHSPWDVPRQKQPEIGVCDQWPQVVRFR